MVGPGPAQLFPLRLFFGGESCVFLIFAFADRGPLFFRLFILAAKEFSNFLTRRQVVDLEGRRT